MKGGESMRKYTLANTDAKETVDLRHYEQQIINAVSSIMPKATITVYCSCYTVEPTPTRGEAIRIGKLLSKADLLGRYCIQIPKLFCGAAVKAKNDTTPVKEFSLRKDHERHAKIKPLGGHF